MAFTSKARASGLSKTSNNNSMDDTSASIRFSMTQGNQNTQVTEDDTLDLMGENDIDLGVESPSINVGGADTIEQHQSPDPETIVDDTLNKLRELQQIRKPILTLKENLKYNLEKNRAPSYIQVSCHPNLGSSRAAESIQLKIDVMITEFKNKLIQTIQDESSNFIGQLNAEITEMYKTTKKNLPNTEEGGIASQRLTETVLKAKDDQQRDLRNYAQKIRVSRPTKSNEGQHKAPYRRMNAHGKSKK